MMDNDELYNTWKGVVAKVSKKVARQFPELEQSDLYQDLFLWIMENNPAREKDDFAFRTLELVALDTAWKYRRQYLAATGQYYYRPQDVRTIVKTYLFNEEYWKTSVKIDEHPLANGDRGSATLDFEDRVAVYADIAKAFDNLSDNYRAVIEKAYRDGDKLTDAEQKRCERAIDRMTDHLNYTRSLPEDARGDYGKKQSK